MPAGGAQDSHADILVVRLPAAPDRDYAPTDAGSRKPNPQLHTEEHFTGVAGHRHKGIRNRDGQRIVAEQPLTSADGSIASPAAG